MMQEITIDGDSLKFDQVSEVAFNSNIKVRLTPEYKKYDITKS